MLVVALGMTAGLTCLLVLFDLLVSPSPDDRVASPERLAPVGNRLSYRHTFDTASTN